MSTGLIREMNPSVIGPPNDFRGLMCDTPSVVQESIEV